MSNNNISITLRLTLARGGEVKGDAPLATAATTAAVAAAASEAPPIRIERYAWGFATETATATVPGQSQVVRVHDFEFWVKMSRATPLLVVGGVTGDKVTEAVLRVRNANAKNAQDFLVYKLGDGVVTSYQTEGAIDSMIPLERFTVRFRTFAMEYLPLKPDGTLGGAVTGSFDLANRGGQTGAAAQGRNG